MATGTNQSEGIGSISFGLNEATGVASPYLAMKYHTNEGEVSIAQAGDELSFAGMHDGRAYPLVDGEHISVKQFGNCMAVAGDTIAVGNFLKLANNGKLVPALTTEFTIGQALVAGEDGDHISVNIFNRGYYLP